MFADAPKLILTSKLQPCTTGEKSKHEKVKDQHLSVPLSLCQSESLILCQRSLKCPMMSENLFLSGAAGRFTWDVAHIPHQCVLALRRWGAKLLRNTGMIIQARLVLEDILSQSVKAANLIHNPLWSSSSKRRERKGQREKAGQWNAD